MWIASKNGHTDVVNALIVANGIVDAARAVDGVTPLWIASACGQEAVTAALLLAGANPLAEAYTVTRTGTSTDSSSKAHTRVLHEPMYPLHAALLGHHFTVAHDLLSAAHAWVDKQCAESDHRAGQHNASDRGTSCQWLQSALHAVHDDVIALAFLRPWMQLLLQWG
jgi:hypothetical protein